MPGSDLGKACCGKAIQISFHDSAAQWVGYFGVTHLFPTAEFWLSKLLLAAHVVPS